MIITNFSRPCTRESRGYRRSAAFDCKFADSRERRYHLLRDGCLVGPAFGIGLLE